MASSQELAERIDRLAVDGTTADRPDVEDGDDSEDGVAEAGSTNTTSKKKKKKKPKKKVSYTMLVI
jgi:hypothetical protein